MFSRWIDSVVPNRPIQPRWKNTCLSPMKATYVRSCSIEHMHSLWELSQFLKGILSANQSFQGRDKLILFQISIFNVVEETRISLQRIPSVLEEGASNTLLPCENWGSFRKECFLQFSIFKVEIGSVPNMIIQQSWRNSCIFPMKTICVRRRSI
jgi:hypothetical protein